ncbi:MAG TPA: YdiU family protein [Gammaproteobacteria bacterium]|nr:YdiU family protein [Gammaproteobacteria bacterium]
MQFPFDNRYASLDETFFERIRPTPVRKPELIAFNDALAGELGISASDAAASAAAVFSGNTLPEGAEPLAMAYAGHQFGHFNPQLGDGRAILLGEIAGPDGARYDIHLKGSGRTRFSRNGDGRAALGPVLREYLVSEAMHRLGVPTTRALAAVTTGEPVARERLLPGGVITRVAASFVRVGTFQYFAAREDEAALRQLADYVIDKCYPQLDEHNHRYAALLAAVVERQAVLIAHWMQLGFIHGVMNTDNMSIAGETIDYGPCAFMDAYRHDQVFSSIDRQGRYAYSNQPAMGLWNLTRLAETLLPLLDDHPQTAVNIAQEVLEGFVARYESAWLAGMREKCGLTACDGVESSEDKALIEGLLEVMAENRADFTLTFYHLSRLPGQPSEQDEPLLVLFQNPGPMATWLQQWRARLTQETQDDAARQTGMQTVNPVYIPRNHQIEAAIRAAEDRDDFSVFHELHAVLQQPCVQQEGKEQYALAPEPEEVVEYTFCGT